MKVSQRGFTLVETIMALAIAGLIIAIVFLALNQAATLRRDSQRKADLARFVTAVRQYASDNSGVYPSTDAQLQDVVATYITSSGATFADPSGPSYTVTGYTDNAGSYATYHVTDLSLMPLGTIAAHTNAICYDSSINPTQIGQQTTTAPGTAATGTQAVSNRNFAAAINLESGGTYCMEIN